MNGLLLALVILVALLVLAAATFFLGMRYGWKPVVNAVRRLNRRFTNPRAMRSAGTPGAYASIIRHRGRTSGKDYETPVVPVPDGEEAFVIVLPYGPGADWVRNVLAAGSATVVREGEVIPVNRPEIVGIERAAGLFPPAEDRNHRLFSVTHCLRVHRAGSI